MGTSNIPNFEELLRAQYEHQQGMAQERAARYQESLTVVEQERAQIREAKDELERLSRLLADEKELVLGALLRESVRPDLSLRTAGSWLRQRRIKGWKSDVDYAYWGWRGGMEPHQEYRSHQIAFIDDGRFFALTYDPDGFYLDLATPRTIHTARQCLANLAIKHTLPI